MVRLEGSIKRFIGLSSDRKPSPGDQIISTDGSVTTVTHADLPPGSSFLESDTGHVARWDGAGWRVSDDPQDSTRELLAALLRETQRLTTLVSLASGVEMQTHEGEYAS